MPPQMLMTPEQLDTLNLYDTSAEAAIEDFLDIQMRRISQLWVLSAPESWFLSFVDGKERSFHLEEIKAGRLAALRVRQEWFWAECRKLICSRGKNPDEYTSYIEERQAEVDAAIQATKKLVAALR